MRRSPIRREKRWGVLTSEGVHRIVDHGLRKKAPVQAHQYYEDQLVSMKAVNESYDSLASREWA